MTWFPLPDEAFVFRNKIRNDEAVLLLIPGKGPTTVVLDGEPYEFDEEKTMQYRIHMHAVARRRGIVIPDDTR